MDDLTSALRGLAEEARPAAADPAALWADGRRRVRHRRAGAVAAVVVVALLAGVIGLLAPVGSRSIEPADLRHAPAVPRTIWPGQEFWPTVGPDDPPGIVAVAAPLEGERGQFVVSATTGEYRRLQLPDAYLGPISRAWALAPDGRHLAYWLDGSPSGRAYSDTGTDDTPVGVGVFDTVTGEVRSYRPESEHGISTDDLTWADSGTLLMTYGQRTSPSSSEAISLQQWRLADDRPQPARLLDSGPVLSPLRGRDGSVLIAGPTSSLGRTTFSTASGTPVATVGQRAVRSVAVSRSFAVARLDALDGAPLRFAPRRPGQDLRFPARGQLAFASLLGFIDDTHVLVRGEILDERGPVEGGPLWRVDLETSERTRVGTSAAGDVAVATDLLGSPLVDGVKPPLDDPIWRIRLSIAGGVLLVGLLALGAVALRRRRRG